MGIKHILIVDDSEVICDMLKPMILENGYSVDTANDCEQAYRKIRERKPDLIVLDLVLPDASGMDFCNHLKQEPDTRMIPVIMCTASAISPQDKVKGLDIGADDYLTKPFEMKELISRIRALLRRSEMFEKELARKDLQPAPAAQEAASVPEGPSAPDFGLLQVLACAFVHPEAAFVQIPALPSGWSAPWIAGILAVIAFFHSFPFLVRTRLWDFFRSFFAFAAGQGAVLLCAAALTYVLILVFFRRRFPFRALVMSFAIAAVPAALAGLLAGIYVLWVGRGADLHQFSAGIGLWLPAVRTPRQEALARVLDVFTLWPVFLAAAGLSKVSRLPAVRLFLAVVIGWTVPIALMAVL